MKKILKISGIVLLVLLIVIISIPFLFKGKILTEVKKTINKEINAKVDFKDFNLSLISSFPQLRLSLEELYVAGIDTFEHDTLVRFDNFTADINLMSIISDEIKIRSIILDNPAFNVIVLEDGTANWDIAKASEEPEKKEEEPNSEPTKFKLALKEFKIIDCDLVYNDKQMNFSTKLKKLNYELKGDFTESFTSLKNKLSIEAIDIIFEKIKYMNKAKFNFDADIDADLEKYKFDFKENKITLNALELGFDGSVIMPGDDIDIKMTFFSKETSFKQLLSLIPAIYMTDFKDIKTKGTFKLNGSVSGVYNDKNLPAFTTNLNVKNGFFQYPDLPKSVDNINVDIKVDNKGGSGDDMIIDISKFHIEMAGNPVDVGMRIIMSALDVIIKGNIDGKLDLNSIADIIPLDDTKINGKIEANVNIDGKLSDIEKEQYENFTADGQINAESIKYESSDFPNPININKAELNFSPKYVKLSTFDLTSGKSDIRMNGSLGNFIAYALTDDGILKGELNVASNLTNASDFMSEESSAETETKESPENQPQTTDTTAMTAVEVPANLDLKLTTDFKKIIYDNLIIDNLKGEVKIKDNTADLTNLSMNMIDGFMLLNGSYNTSNIKNPAVKMNFDIENIDIPLAFKTFNTIKKIAPIAENCSGKVSANFSLDTKLDYYMSPVYETLNGAGNFKSNNITIGHSKAINKLATALKSDKLKKNSLKNIDVSFKITDGVITIEPFETQIGEYKTTISGTQGLDQSINYKLNINMPLKKLGNATNKLLNNLVDKANNKGIAVKKSANIDIVALITGKTDDPKVRLSLSDAQQEVKEQIKEEVKEKVKEKVNDAIDEAQRIADKNIKKAEKETEKIKKAAKEAGKKLIDEADKQGKELIKKAGNNPMKKLAAEKTADKLNKEAAKRAKQLNNEAEINSKKILDRTKAENEKIIKKARDKNS